MNTAPPHRSSILRAWVVVACWIAEVAACGSAATANVTCRPVGRYQVGKEGGYLPCCPELVELPTLLEATTANGTRVCEQFPVNSYSCIEGTCGDGICEDVEGPCGCGVDCPDSLTGTNSPVCEGFGDDAPPSDEPRISVVNTGSRALYLQTPSSCQGPLSLVHVERDGQAIHVPAFGCAASCQEALDDAWTLDSEGPAEFSCPVFPDCGSPVVLIEPGQTRSTPAGLEAVFRRLPRGCADGISTPAVNCYSRVIPSPGDYTLSVRAGTDIGCLAGSPDCDCQPDLSGICMNPNVRLSDAPLVFSLSSPSYYQNQQISVSADPD